MYGWGNYASGFGSSTSISSSCYAKINDPASPAPGSTCPADSGSLIFTGGSWYCKKSGSGILTNPNVPSPPFSWECLQSEIENCPVKFALLGGAALLLLFAPGGLKLLSLPLAAGAVVVTSIGCGGGF